MSSPTAWRPCCGNCRSELLEVVTAQGSLVYTSQWRCQDCGAPWDGSELSAEEAADRPRPPAPPGVTPDPKAQQEGD